MIQTKVVIDDNGKRFVFERNHKCRTKAKRYLAIFEQTVNADNVKVFFFGRIFTVSNQFINLK